MQIIVFLLFFLLSSSSMEARKSLFSRSKNKFTIMLDPAGDAKHTGRKIGNTFERGLTLQFAEKLKKKLEKQYKNITVHLTRFPGEMVYPLQNANYANRLQVNLYININFYQEIDTIPQLFLYRFSHHDEFISPSDKLLFLRYDQAHLFHRNTIQKWSEIIKDTLLQTSNNKFKTNGIYKLPFKPLTGIISPAISIEAGLKEPNNWKSYITPITHAIGAIIEKYA